VDDGINGWLRAAFIALASLHQSQTWTPRNGSDPAFIAALSGQVTHPCFVSFSDPRKEQ
jgi:hypothetical protein